MLLLSLCSQKVQRRLFLKWLNKVKCEFKRLTQVEDKLANNHIRETTDIRMTPRSQTQARRPSVQQVHLTTVSNADSLGIGPTNVPIKEEVAVSMVEIPMEALVTLEDIQIVGLSEVENQATSRSATIVNKVVIGREIVHSLERTTSKITEADTKDNELIFDIII